MKSYPSHAIAALTACAFLAGCSAEVEADWGSVAPSEFESEDDTGNSTNLGEVTDGGEHSPTW